MWRSNNILKKVVCSCSEDFSKLSFNSFQNAKYTSFSSSEISSLIDVQSNLKEQILSGKPVVALESTIITHGMPYPHNLETALQVEECVKIQGSTPATIAVLDGRIKVGLRKDELERLSYINSDKKNTSESVIKCSKRDLAYAVSKKLCGGTTVAGTLFIANKLGIQIFATGGIGGVHRNGHETFDISADLIELGRTPMAVICSGVKSILDIPRTLEFLETQGVLVSSYQNSNFDFPAFYTRSSGCKVPYNLNNPEEAANLIRSLSKLKLNSGILIGVPIPHENAVSEEIINNAIENALNKCKNAGIFGKVVTPFVLEEVSKSTKGESLTSNIALIKNNAKVASEIAAQLHKNFKSSDSNGGNNSNQDIIKNESIDIPVKKTKNDEISSTSRNVPVVIGASILDITMKVQDDFQLNGATYCTETKISSGGVGRNIAEGIWKQYGNVNFISAIGNDDMGKNIKSKMPSECTEGVVCIKNRTTSICNVIIDKTGECKLVLGNMEIHKEISPHIISKYDRLLKNAPIIIMDANLPIESIQKVLELSIEYNIPVFYEPTDMTIAHKPFYLPEILTKQIKFMSPNIYELQAISNIIKEKKVKKSTDIKPFQNKIETLNVAKNLLNQMEGFFECTLLTLGQLGVIVDGQINLQQSFFDENCVYSANSCSNRKLLYFEAPKVHNLINVSGAGDSFCSGFITGMLKQYTLAECVGYGFSAAKNALQSHNAVPEHYSLDAIVKDDIKHEDITIEN